MTNKPTHDILLAEEYEAADGEVKSNFTRIGSAWTKESGAMSCQLREGLAVSGRFVILPRREKAEADS